MNCPTIQDLFAHAEGAVNPGVERHAAGCARCRKMLSIHRNLSALTPADAPKPTSPCPGRSRWETFLRAPAEDGPLVDHLSVCGLCLQTVAALQDSPAPVSRPARKLRRRSRLWPALATAAAAAVVVGIVWWISAEKPDPNPRPEPSTAGTPPPRVAEPPIPSADDRRKREEEQRLRIEAQMREEVERAREALRRSEPPPEPAPRPAPRPVPRPTRAAAAQVVSAQGSVYLASGEKAAAGRSLLAGDGIRTGRNGWATIAFGDATRIELRSSTSIREVHERDAQGPGKRVILERGQLEAEVSPQPGNQPLEIRTPNGTLTVLGTTFRVAADGETTRLVVREGRVKLARTSDGASVEVPAGSFAVAAEGADLRARPARSVWKHTFDTDRGLGQGTRMTLREGDRDVTVAVPLPRRAPAGYSDGKIAIRGTGVDDGSILPLFVIPEQAEFRIRVRSEKPVKIECQLVVDPDIQKQAFEVKRRVEVGPRWREITFLPEDFFLWLDQSPMNAGTEIPVFNIYTFGEGQVFVDRIEVVSLSAHD